MRIIARDRSLTSLNEVDMYTSFIWTDRYFKAGDFELRVPCTQENKKLFDDTKYLTMDKSDRVMVLEKRQVKTQVDKADEYIIKGRSAETLLDRRVIMGSMTFGIAPHDEETNETASQSYAVDNFLIWYGSLCRVIKSVSSGDRFILYKPEKGNLYEANIRLAAAKEEAELTQPIEDIVFTLLNTTVINPTDPTRMFTNPRWRYIRSTDPKVQEIKMAASFANTNLYDALSSLLVGAGLSCKVVYNEDTETFDFSLFKGVDHSIAQSENMVVNFKSSLDNLVSTDFLTDEEDYKTCGYVVGAIDEKKTWTLSVADEFGRISDIEVANPNYCTTWCQQVSLNGTGMSYERREVIIDAADIDRYQTVSAYSGTTGTDVAVSETDYRAMLKTRGKTKLMEMYSTYDLDAEILPDMFYKYMVDYSLGDTISIEDRFGNTINASITELIFSQDINGYKAYPTIESIGNVDGMDQLVSIFVNNPIHVNIDRRLVIPDVREELTDLRGKTFIAYYVAEIIDYFLEGHLPYVQQFGGGYRVVSPSLDDMDKKILGGSITEIYANPGNYTEVNTKALQFIKFVKEHQFKINAEQIIIPPYDDMPSAVT